MFMLHRLAWERLFEPNSHHSQRCTYIWTLDTIVDKGGNVEFEE